MLARDLRNTADDSLDGAQGTPVVYISLNYRLGPFGFPQGREAEERGALNLGLKDQLAALEWIQERIGDFGGDPKKVCLSRNTEVKP